MFSSWANSPMGYAVAAGIGAYYANKNKEIIIHIGDGGMQINLQDLQTLAHYAIPLKIFLWNNFGYATIQAFQEGNLDKRYHATDTDHGYSSPNFEELSKVFKLSYFKVSQDNDVDETPSSDSLNQNLLNTTSPLLGNLRSDFGGLFYNLEDTIQINTIINDENVRKLIPSNIKFLWSVKPLSNITDANGNVTDIDGDVIELFIIKTSRGGKAPLTGEVITDARQDLDQSARPSISMQMNSNGAKNWRRLTSQNIGRRVAIVLDDFVYSAPFVQNEIPNGNSQITGNFTIEEAQDLANILKAGALPAPTTIVEDVVIGPTLGKVAQSQGIRSIVSGLMIVLLFMIFYYSGGGIVANFALFFNIFFILGILAQLSASLTLPGIAGIVLTIGMSIDANVLIFERIKEELKDEIRKQRSRQHQLSKRINTAKLKRTKKSR